jgi:hypothetical protein
MADATLIHLKDGTPAAPSGYRNVKWQQGAPYATTATFNNQQIAVQATDVSAYEPNLGGVDARTTTTETIGVASLGKLVTFGNAGATAVTLSSSVPADFLCAFEVLGAGTATLTPSSGTINGVASLAAATGIGGWLFFDGTNWKAVLSLGPGASQPFDVLFNPNSVLGSNTIYDIAVFVRTVVFPGSFAGAAGHCRVNPATTQTITVNKNGSSIGTISISSSGVFSFTTTGGAAQTFSAGDYMTFTTQVGADTSMLMHVTLTGTR